MRYFRIDFDDGSWEVFKSRFDHVSSAKYYCGYGMRGIITEINPVYYFFLKFRQYWG